ncbi:uncharacterized protein LOC135834918 isoform X2 [Planococcus citri]|uniref:uncharacterized protein LOC135834918 isoform X2 n=1 Tax=Planococcus citri TaxID=170843 RepID=UPI0031F82E6D
MLDFQAVKMLHAKMRRKTKVYVFILVLMTVITEIKPENDTSSTTTPKLTETTTVAPTTTTPTPTTTTKANIPTPQILIVNQTGSAYPVNYTWYQNDQPLQNGSAIFLVNASQCEAGYFKYSCQACNSGGCAKHIFHVTILTPEKIEKCVGQTANLVCELHDTVRTIDWYGPYEALSDPNYDPDADPNSMVEMNGQIYRKENLKLNDSGWYLCDKCQKGNKWMHIYLNVTNGSKCQNLNSTTFTTSPTPPKGSNSIVYIIDTSIMLTGIIIGVVIGAGCVKYIMKKDVGVVDETELKTICAPEKTRIKNVRIYPEKCAQPIFRSDTGGFY